MLPFSLKEIERVIIECNGNKSSGPDGFNFNFIKSFWSLLSGEIQNLFDQFHGNATLPKDILSYFVTIIPKVTSHFSLSEFRPISLFGSVYKIIAKV
jgi:hypothetical protein